MPKCQTTIINAYLGHVRVCEIRGRKIVIKESNIFMSILISVPFLNLEQNKKIYSFNNDVFFSFFIGIDCGRNT